MALRLLYCFLIIHSWLQSSRRQHVWLPVQPHCFSFLFCDTSNTLQVHDLWTCHALYLELYARVVTSFTLLNHISLQTGFSKKSIWPTPPGGPFYKLFLIFSLTYLYYKCSLSSDSSGSPHFWNVITILLRNQINLISFNEI